MNTKRSKTRAVLAGLALAAAGSAGAYGISALPADVAPTTEDESAAMPTAVEYAVMLGF